MNRKVDGPAAELKTLLKSAPDTRMMEILVPDTNGILRGKRIARDEFETLYTRGLNCCGGTTLLDCKGATIDELKLGTVDGDPDVIAHPVPATLAPVPWLDTPTAQVLVALRDPDGRPFHGDPRTVLNRAIAALAELGLKAVVATEYEFYLLEESNEATPRPKRGRVPGTTMVQDGLQYAMLEDLWDCEDFLSAVDSACETQKIPIGTALSEFAPGQFEINLHHVDNAALACDHGVMLKRAVKGVARKLGLGASFMAKTFQDDAGSGLHVHVSVLDESGRNVLAEPGSKARPPISDTMRHAVGGLLATMHEAMAIFAPTANSYRRLQPKSYVPLAPNWGYNHRSLALRIPLSDPENLRIEHRVAGADANPYLVVAAILAGIHHGVSKRCDPGPMIEEGTLIEDEAIVLPTRWGAALDAFEQAQVLPRYFGEDYCRMFAIMRRAESERFHAEISNRDYEWYLRNV